jgi:double zinc ribbon protein
MQLAIFGISNDALNLAVNLIVLFLVVVWFALVYWTYADAKRRMEDQVLIGCAAGASFLFPYLGSIIYTILRPPEFLEDQHERDLEIRASELRVRQLTEQSCPHCAYPIDKSYLRCPNCRRRVKEPCGNCGKPLDPRWGVCPYCEAEVPRRAPKQPAPGARRPAQQRPAAGRKAPPKQGKPAQRKPAQRQGQKRAARPAAAQQRPRAETAEDAPPRQGGGSSRPAPTP